ncbi:uncharacterized protein LOC34622960 [Cyclospora cayetanensis]|uniref:Uncharacterized protein LOC34622960 n=2 Tax=Cyclospora cayetanensis TaxID=88456 RepID=A0A6P5WEW0_9EIME|nr:uncharacterized protein LOC34622960 [Cyclospora cayetanensis]OEH74989.1 alpha beta fold family protein [Cyclospora cayetanensis]
MVVVVHPWGFGMPSTPCDQVRLSRWQLVMLPSHCQARRDSEKPDGEAAPGSSGWIDGRMLYCVVPHVAAGAVHEQIEVPQCFTTSASLFLIRLRFLRAMASTISQNELLDLWRLAKAAASPRERSTHFLATTMCATDSDLQEGASGGSPEHLKRRQGPARPRIRFNPLDVCALLISGAMDVNDLPLLEKLEAAAEEAEKAEQQKGRWSWLAGLVRSNQTRGHIWKAAACKLRLDRSSHEPSSQSHRKMHALAGSHPHPFLYSHPSGGTQKDMVLTDAAPAQGPFGMRMPGRAPQHSRSMRSPQGDLGAQEEAVEVPPSRTTCASTSQGSGGFPDRHTEHLSEEEEMGEDAAAAISRRGSTVLALLPHGCRWPQSMAVKERDPSGGSTGALPSGCLHRSPQVARAARDIGEFTGGSAFNDGWKEAVGFRIKRSGVGSRRRRELERRRQRLSPLDPPYDAYALLLHPFCVTPSTSLPDVETARASEVHEVALDFLSRAKATEACPQCNRSTGTSRDAGVAEEAGRLPPPRCPLHQTLHYTKVGEGPENVILIHGICMSGYFFADVIRVLFPQSEGISLGASSHDDPHERWRYTFYCVDLLGYGKSSAVPPTQNYSRREQAEAILRDVVLENGLTSVHLVGHSFGGLVAAELCEMLPPGFVTTLILLAPAYFESERQAMRILTASHFPASHTVAHPYFGEFLLRLGVVLRPFFEPLVLSIVPRGELPQLSVADVFSIHPDALTGTIRSIVQDRVDRTFQLLRQRGQRASVFHGTADGVIPIRQARFLALRYPNIHVRALAGFVHHFPASHAQFTAHIIIQEIGRSLRNGRGLSYSLDDDPASALIASHALLLPGHPTWD